MTSDPVRSVSEREKALVRYFRELPEEPDHKQATFQGRLGAVLVGLGIVFGLGASSYLGRHLLSTALLIGGCLVGGRGLAQYFWDRYQYEQALGDIFPQPTDEAVDLWLADAQERLHDHSLEKLGLMKEDCEFIDLPPVRGPVVRVRKGLIPDNIVWKVGRDGAPRFGVYQVAYLWFAKDHLAIFGCFYDLIRDAILNQDTYEYYYQDIVSVSTREIASSYTLPTGFTLTSEQEFRIAVSNGSYFSLTVGASQLKQLTGAERVPDNGVEDAIQAIRKKLQEKKYRLLS